MFVEKENKNNQIILQQRESSRRYIHDYYARVEDTQCNTSPFSVGGAVSSFSKKLAKKKAVSEAIERYCGSHVFGKITRGSFIDLNLNAVDPQKIIYFNEAQYISKSFPYKKFCPNMEINWVKGCSLKNGKGILVPAFSVYIGYNRLIPKSEVISPTISSGLALATTIEKAIVRGIFELIERDSIMINYMVNEKKLL